MSRSIGRYLVELLVANGIDTVFGIPGVHNLELYRGLAAANLRHILVRHEQGAGFAADGYARMSGRAAAAFTISGPGLTNILTSAAQAYSDSIPLLVVATTPVRASLGKQWGVLHELHNQWALAAGVFGVARAASSALRASPSSAFCLASSLWFSCLNWAYTLNWLFSSLTMETLSPDFIAIVASVMCDW